MDQLDEYDIKLCNALENFLKKYPRSKIRHKINEIHVSDLDTFEMEWCINQYDILISKFDLNVDFISAFIDPKDKTILLRMLDSNGKMKELKSN